MPLTRGRRALLILGGLLLGTLLGCSGRSPRSLSPPDCGGCAEAIPQHGECEECARRWIAGREVPSATLHEALDAHGHEVDVERIICLECAEMVEVDGFCRRCRMGWIGEQLYYSEFSWALHHGTVRSEEPLECRGCRELRGEAGTCGRCGTGWVGVVAFDDRSAHRIAMREFRRLEEAIERSRICDPCGATSFFGVLCPTCGSRPIPPAVGGR